MPKSATKAPRAGIGRGGNRGISTILLARPDSIGAFVADLDTDRVRTGSDWSHATRAPHLSQVPLLAAPPGAEHGAPGGSFRGAPDCEAVRTAQSCGNRRTHPGRGPERSSQGARIGSGPRAPLAPDPATERPCNRFGHTPPHKPHTPHSDTPRITFEVLSRGLGRGAGRDGPPSCLRACRGSRARRDRRSGRRGWSGPLGSSGPGSQTVRAAGRFRRPAPAPPHRPSRMVGQRLACRDALGLLGPLMFRWTTVKVIQRVVLKT